MFFTKNQVRLVKWELLLALVVLVLIAFEVVYSKQPVDVKKVNLNINGENVDIGKRLVTNVYQTVDGKEVFTGIYILINQYIEPLTFSGGLYESADFSCQSGENQVEITFDDKSMISNVQLITRDREGKIRGIYFHDHKTDVPIYTGRKIS